MFDKLIAAVLAAFAALTFVVPAPTTQPPPPAPPVASSTTSEAPEQPVEAPEPESPSFPPIVETSQVTDDVDVPSNWMEDMLPDVDPGGYGNWIFERNGAWGASDGYTVWIDPDVPEDVRYSVMVHEYGHLLQADYYGSIWDSPDVEGEADCIAEILGASWTNYGCTDDLMSGARRVLSG